jgi:hypothetical protein
MNTDSTGQRYPNWMPTAGGVLNIVAGSLGLVGTIFLLVFGDIFGSRVLKTSFPSSVWQHWVGARGRDFRAHCITYFGHYHPRFYSAHQEGI